MNKYCRNIVSVALILCLCFSVMSLQASAETPIDKVLTTISNDPVALMDVSFITAATSTAGCYVSSYCWYDLSGNVLQGKFGTDACRLEIRLDASEGYVFSEGISAYINNSSVSVSRDASGSFVVLSREYAPMVWLPTVIKQPGGEKITAGGWASFVSTATYTESYSWKFVSPTGGYFSEDELVAKFPGVSIEGGATEKMNIYNVPLEMDGWKVLCRFSGPGGSVDSQGANITVQPAPATVTPTPEPTVEPTPEPTPEIVEEEDHEDAGHEHGFSDVWEFDDAEHWHSCDCGETSDRAAHSMNWTEVEEATRRKDGLEKGLCSQCGYEQERPIEYRQDDEDSAIKIFRYIFFGIIAIIVLLIILLIRYAIASRRYYRKRRRR